LLRLRYRVREKNEKNEECCCCEILSRHCR
jgi:hypothetical protein